MATDRFDDAVWQERLPIPRGADGMVWKGHGRAPSVPEHRHQELEFNLVLQGQARYLAAGRRYDIGRGSATWLFPAQPHVLLDRSADLQFWVVVFRPALIRRCLTQEGDADVRRAAPHGSNYHRVFNDRASASVSVLAERATAFAEAGDVGRLNAVLAYMLVTVWDLFNDAHSVLARPVHPAVAACAAALRDDPAAADLEQLASDAGLSLSRLSHLFSDQLGITLTAYRAQQRVDLLLRRLQREPERKLLPLALDCGFGSYTQFHRTFRAVTGSAPGRYLNRRTPRAPAPGPA